MSHIRLTGSAFCAVAVCLFLSGFAVGDDEPDRVESVLAWDDGEADAGLIRDGMHLAVGFQAPEWADFVVGAHFYIWPFSLADLAAPHRETRPIRIWVMKPHPDHPGTPGGGPVGFTIAPGGYPEQAWLEVDFSEPVDLTDPDEFPDRWFFIAMEWLYRHNPILGVDTDLPIDGNSWDPDSGSGWVPFEEFDVMVRAVVADTAETAVEPVHWGVIKTGYR